jgi:RNA polymerase sigma-70 factor, ECF subfamily
MQNNKFEEIIAKTKPIVLAAIKQHLNRNLVDFIDDVMQETYFKAYKTLLKNTDIKSIENYLFIIAKNECFKTNKKEKPYIELKDEHEHFYEKDTSFPKMIAEIISNLPYKYKQVAELFYQKQFSLVEISKYSNLSIGAVKSRLFRSRSLIINQAKELELT